MDSAVAAAGGIVPTAPIPSSSSATFPPAAASVVDDVVSAKVASRVARAEERRLVLLAEARDARVAWVLGDDDDDDDRVDDDYDEDIANDKGDENSNDIGGDLLSGLRACRADALPCAPLVIDAMLTGRGRLPSSSASIGRRRRHHHRRGDEGTDDDDDGEDGVASLRNLAVRRALDDRRLEWGRVSDVGGWGMDDGRTTTTTKRGERPDEVLVSDLDDHPTIATPHPDEYKSFLVALSSPIAADVVLSCMKFCATMKEASNVVSSSTGEGGGDVVDEDGAVEGGVAASSVVLASISRAIRGFVAKTTRLIEEHEAFRDFHSSFSSSSTTRAHGEAGEDRRTQESSSDEAAAAASRERLSASVEKFVYGKCRRDIDAVLSRSSSAGGGGGGKSWVGDTTNTSGSGTVGEADAELHERVRSLQFVTPAHLEIRCLARSSAGTGEADAMTSSAHYADIDLSRAARRIRSLHRGRSSPREVLRSILMAHRGVTVALNEVCGLGVSDSAPSPPGADDVLPALILTTLRSRATRLISALRFVEAFAPPSMLRGEVGYAYTSLCGAVQFLRELDVNGHVRGVTLLGGAGETSAVLSIGPDDFRAGLEECRRKMMVEDEMARARSLRDRSGDCIGENTDVTVDLDEHVEGDESMQIKITGRQVRDARSRGEVVDLDWALKKQQEAMWQRGTVVDLISKSATNQSQDTIAAHHQHESLDPYTFSLPSQFSRSYSFLTVNTDNISVRDLPLLLNEYKMLVHVTELLLNERTVWRESERKRLSRLERKFLERELGDVMKVDEDAGGGGSV
jgi:hypothetical protein